MLPDMVPFRIFASPFATPASQRRARTIVNAAAGKFPTSSPNCVASGSRDFPFRPSLGVHGPPLNRTGYCSMCSLLASTTFSITNSILSAGENHTENYRNYFPAQVDGASKRFIRAEERENRTAMRVSSGKRYSDEDFGRAGDPAVSPSGREASRAAGRGQADGEGLDSVFGPLGALRFISAPQALGDGVVRAALEVDGPFVGVIIGKQGQTVQEIQTRTGANVRIRQQGNERRRSREPACIEIECASVENVEAAVTLIRIIVEEAIEGHLLEYSHFVSLPLACHPDLVAHFIAFRDSILREIEAGPAPSEPDSAAQPTDDHRSKDASIGTFQEIPEGKRIDDSTSLRGWSQGASQDPSEEASLGEGEGPEGGMGPAGKSTVGERNFWAGLKKQRTRPHAGVDPTIFVNPRTFHITVQMLKLWNQRRVEAAGKALESALPAVLEALGSRPLKLHIANLEIMRGNPTKAHVVYAAISEEDGTQTRLLQACEVLRGAMRDAGLVTKSDQSQPLKIHATLMNTSHRNGKQNKRSFKRLPFDATQIIEDNEKLDWGYVTISEAHLSQRFVFRHDGYYHCCASIHLPSD